MNQWMNELAMVAYSVVKIVVFFSWFARSTDGLMRKHLLQFFFFLLKLFTNRKMKMHSNQCKIAIMNVDFMFTIKCLHCWWWALCGVRYWNAIAPRYRYDYYEFYFVLFFLEFFFVYQINLYSMPHVLKYPI